MDRLIRYRSLLAILLLCPLGLLAQARDYWYKVERKGTGFANEHVKVTKLPGGNVRYDSEAHIKIDFNGRNHDLFLTSVYVVDRKLRPVTFETRRRTARKETHATGRRAGKQIIATVRENGGPPVTKTISSRNVYFDFLLHELIAKNARRKKFRLDVIEDTESLAIGAKDVEISRIDDNEIEAVIEGAVFPTRYRVGRDGQLRESQVVERQARTYLTSAEDARNITYLEDDELAVRSQRQFPNVYRVAKAQVQVRWKKLPFSEFRLEDNRQKIVRKNQSGEQFEAVLEIIRPSDVTLAPDRPLPDQTMYLGEDELIKPGDAGIRKQATAIAGETKSRAEIVRRLLDWVNTNVVYEIILETLPGPEVLEKKRGKCSEYAVLFASLARAMGIPTRIVLGEAYSDGRWDGHMWNEVWLGEWVAVDPTAGLFVVSPTHLKLIDSPTIKGTRIVRHRLVDNLEIEILDFVEDKRRTPLVTGIRGSTYSNANFDCRISAPDETWVLKEESNGDTATFSMKLRQGDAEFTLVLFPVRPGRPGATFLEGRLNAISKKIRDYKLIEQGEAYIAGREAPLAVFCQRGDRGTIVNHNILLVDGSSAYLFAFIAPEAEFARLGPLLKKILASFELVH